jgi:hypothetical protein
MFGEHRLPNQERRASARRGSVTDRACIGDRFLRTDYVSPRTFASRHHGWLTPAAPGARRPFAVKNDIRAVQTHVSKSGGRQPAVGRSPVALARRSEQCSANTDCRIKSGGRQPAVGRIHACIGNRFLRTDYVSPRTFASRYHGWLTPAAPGCTTFVRCEKRRSRCTNARFQERRASARRGCGN